MKKSLVIMFSFAVLFTGCGTNRSGTYTGTEVSSVQGTSPLNSQVNLQITSGKDSNLSGTYNASSGGAQFSGTVSSDGNMIQNVSVNIAQSTSGSTINGVPSAGCGGTYTGNLTLSNTSITGTLTLSNPASGALLPPPTGPSGNYNNGYPTANPYSNNGYQNGGYYSGGLGANGSSYCLGATRNINLTKQ